VHHRTIQINHQPDVTVFQFISWRLFTAQHVSGVFPPIIRSSMTAVAASGFTFLSWWQSCCVRGRAGSARTRTQHDYHNNTKVKPEAATADIELLMMGGNTPETSWDVNKHQDINWKVVASGWWFIWIKYKTPVPKTLMIFDSKYPLHFRKHM
jgi:hypothetical protein